MTQQAFTQRFLGAARSGAYRIYTNRDGLAAVDFGHRQLHEGHISRLLQYAATAGGAISTADFERLVPGRPCARPGFLEICERARLLALTRTHGGARVCRLTE